MGADTCPKISRQDFPTGRKGPPGEQVVYPDVPEQRTTFHEMVRGVTGSAVMVNAVGRGEE